MNAREPLYAAGVYLIDFTQHWFKDYATFFAIVNDLANPYYQTEYVFPAISVVDAVFAAQFILCMAFGGWMNAVMKWWLLECRPYWWVQNTTYYDNGYRPRLLQTSQTCETGPGSPSGHSTSMAMTVVLIGIWIAHVLNDRKINIWWWKYLAYPLFVFALVSVMLARVFVAAHFPHQVVVGAIIGLYLAPGLCIYVTDPTIWPITARPSTNFFLRLLPVFTCIAIAFVTYESLVSCGVDPQWTVDLAYRYCENPENIHVSTTPMYALVQSTGYLLGCALSINPGLAKYRHYTKKRSLPVAILATFMATNSIGQLVALVPKENETCFYSVLFLANAFKTWTLLCVNPFVAQWPMISHEYGNHGRRTKQE